MKEIAVYLYDNDVVTSTVLIAQEKCHRKSEDLLMNEVPPLSSYVASSSAQSDLNQSTDDAERSARAVSHAVNLSIFGEVSVGKSATINRIFQSYNREASVRAHIVTSGVAMPMLSINTQRQEQENSSITTQLLLDGAQTTPTVANTSSGDTYEEMSGPPASNRTRTWGAQVLAGEPTLEQVLEAVNYARSLKTNSSDGLAHLLEPLDKNWLFNLYEKTKNPELLRILGQKIEIRSEFEKALIGLSCKSRTGHIPTCFVCFELEPEVSSWLKNVFVPDLELAGFQPVVSLKQLSAGKELNAFQAMIRTSDYAVVIKTPLLQKKCTDRHKRPTGVAREIQIALERQTEKQVASSETIVSKGALTVSLRPPFFVPKQGTVLIDSEEIIGSYYVRAFELFSAFKGINQSEAQNIKTSFFQNVRTILEKQEFSFEELKRASEDRDSETEVRVRAISSGFAKRMNCLTLPSYPMSFGGRRDELAKLTSMYENGVRQVAITGLGGVGKTCLAAAYAHENVQSYRFIYWIQASDKKPLKLALLGLANELKLQGNEERRIKELGMWLSKIDSKHLLVFDNCNDTDHLDELRDLMSPTHDCHWLMTCVTSEQPRRAGFTPLKVAPLEPKEAELFLPRALSFQNVAHVTNIDHAGFSLPWASSRMIRQIGVDTSLFDALGYSLLGPHGQRSQNKDSHVGTNFFHAIRAALDNIRTLSHRSYLDLAMRYVHEGFVTDHRGDGAYYSQGHYFRTDTTLSPKLDKSNPQSRGVVGYWKNKAWFIYLPETFDEDIQHESNFFVLQASLGNYSSKIMEPQSALSKIFEGKSLAKMGNPNAKLVKQIVLLVSRMFDIDPSQFAARAYNGNDEEMFNCHEDHLDAEQMYTAIEILLSNDLVCMKISVRHKVCVVVKMKMNEKLAYFINDFFAQYHAVCKNKTEPVEWTFHKVIDTNSKPSHELTQLAHNHHYAKRTVFQQALSSHQAAHISDDKDKTTISAASPRHRSTHNRHEPIHLAGDEIDSEKAAATENSLATMTLDDLFRSKEFIQQCNQSPIFRTLLASAIKLKLYAMNFEKFIFFLDNQAELVDTTQYEGMIDSAQTERPLTATVNLLRKYPFLHIKIEGHHSDEKNNEQEHRISGARAEYIKNLIVAKDQGKQKTFASRVTANGVGATKPLDASLTPNQLRNRVAIIRIDIDKSTNDCQSTKADNFY